MDFSLPHIHTPSVVTNSTIQHLPVPAVPILSSSKNGGNDKGETENTEIVTSNNKDTQENVRADSTDYDSLTLDEKLNLAANKTSAELFFGPSCPASSNNGESTMSIVDAAAYPERSTPQSELIQSGSLVVIFESFDNLKFCYATPKSIFSNRNGHFHHDDFIGKPFGSKIRSRNNRGYGHVHVLKPTPELWARSLNHRTQIIHELDSSMIVYYLHLRPNMVVCESGTGSGALSHAIMRCIAPSGHLHTYEFNALRAETARTEFDKNGVGHLVTVYHRDVCGKQQKKLRLEENNNNNNKDTVSQQKDDEKNEDQKLSGNGTVQTNSKDEDNPPHQHSDDGEGGFQRPAGSVDAVILDLPEPWEAVRHAAVCLKSNGRIASYSPCMEQTQRTVVALKKYGFHSIQTREFRLKEYYVDEIELNCVLPKTKRPRSVYDPRYRNPDPFNIRGSDDRKESKIETTNDQSTADRNTEAAGVAPTGKEDDDNNNGAGSQTKSNSEEKTKKRLIARPFVTMRGHTAFLTFATRSICHQNH